MSRRYDRRLKYILPGVFAGVASFTFLSQGIKSSTDAASLDKFDPGNIISDYTMGNYESMTEAQIQEFLTNKNSCKNKDKARYDELTATYEGVYTWHWKDNHFVCLSEELFGDGEIIGEGETAAHIIWQAAQDYKINPQALLVLLQKETSLVTDPIPNDKDYRKATGYGCPDTAACNEKYYGFKNQIRNAANLFHNVLTGGWTNYPLGQNFIQYNPNANCGGSMVEIKNLATSSLYRYTPYQPNAATIAAGYGTAECGAYGNRNFYLYFSDWFGDPTVEPEEPKEPEESEKPETPEVPKTDDEPANITTTTQNTTETAPKKDDKTDKSDKNDKTDKTDKTEDKNKSDDKTNTTTTTTTNEKISYKTNDAITKYWNKLGGSKGTLGKPLADMVEDKSTNATWQKFEKGYIIGNSKTGYFESIDPIRKVWAANGYQSGKLGLPLDAVKSNDIATWQRYQNGYIVGSDKTGYFVSSGKIRDAWAANGYESGKLGLPIGEAKNNDIATWQKYQNGYIVGSDKTGYFASYGKIREVWAAKGYESGKLGLPVDTVKSNDKATWQRYQKGYIVGSDKTGYFVSSGKIRDVWGANGYENGKLGLPIDYVKSNDKATWQKYQDGYIVGNDKTGYFVSSGKIREAWGANGYENGKLGLPIEEVKTNGDIQSQQYQHGKITYNTKTSKTEVKTN